MDGRERSCSLGVELLALLCLCWVLLISLVELKRWGVFFLPSSHPLPLASHQLPHEHNAKEDKEL